MRTTVVRGLPVLATLLFLSPSPLPAQPPPAITSVVNGATFSAQPGIASGAWLTVFGSNLSTVTRSWTASDFVNGQSPTVLSGVSVTINGKPAFPAFVSPTQLNVLAPDDPTVGTVTVRVNSPSGVSNDFAAAKAALSPGLFLFTSPPAVRYPAAQHADYSFAGPANLIVGAATTPARPGDVILLYGTGFGATRPAIPAGSVLSAAVPVDQPVTATIGGASADVAGYLIGPGLYQFNVTVPNVPDGDAALALTVGGQSTPAGVFLAVMRPLPSVWISLWPATALVASGQTRSFLARNNSGLQVPVTWTVTGGGTIDANGLYTAPATVAGPTKVNITATTQASPTVSASASATVVPLGTAMYGSALEPSLAIGGPPGNPTFVVTWYQDFTPFPGRNGALGLLAAISRDGQSWTTSVVPVSRCVSGGKYVPPDGLNYMIPANARVAVGPDGTIYVVAVAQVNLRRNLSLLAASLQPGASNWTAVTVEDNSSPDMAYHADEPSVTADPHVPGTAYAVWMHTSGANCSTTWYPYACPALTGKLSITKNFGRTWSAPQSLPVSGDWRLFSWPRVVVDPFDRQTLYIYYGDSQTTANSANISFIRSTDGGLTWSRPVTVVPPGEAAAAVSALAVNSRNGKFHLAYVQPGTVFTLVVTTSTDRGVSWSAPVRISTGVPPAISMAVTGDGTLALAYQSFGVSWGYSVVTSGDGGLTWSQPLQFAAVDFTVAPNNFLGDYLFEVADRGGAFGIAYAKTHAGVRPSAAVYYTDMAGTTQLLSGTDPLAGCTINPFP